MLENKEKIIIYCIIAIVAMLLLVVLINIWSGFFGVNSMDINSYTSRTYEDTLESYYTSYLKSALKTTNFDELYLKINSSYMENLGITDKDELKEYLRNKNLISMNYTIDEIELYSSTYGSNIFLVSYTVSNMQKYVNIIETKPYVFTISFVQDDNLKELLTNVNLSKTVDDIYYDFEIVESTKNYIKFNLTITNNSVNTVEYDFSYLSSVQLLYGDSSMNMAAVANSSTVDYEIAPNSSKSIELTFNLSFSNQINISGVKFNNVRLNGSSITVQL